MAISVTDRGRGVPPARLPHLFRKYTPPAGDRERGLSGRPGLSICKGLVEAARRAHMGDSAGADRARASPSRCPWPKVQVRRSRTPRSS